MEHLPKLCEAMCRCNIYACKYDVCGLMYKGGTNSFARMYQDTRYIIFKLGDYVT
jgi:RecB family endonuclease NucS